MWQKEFAIERTINEKICIDRDGNPIPWYTYPAIEYLSQFDVTDKDVFEFGCGNSSLFWADRARLVTSIEDNPDWFAKWQKSFNRPNLDIRWRDEGEGYYNAIFEDSKKYDIIVVDGKRRADCARTALKALNQGGIIILDDSDRINTSKEYADAVASLKNGNLIQVDFYGFCPMNVYTKTTSVFLSLAGRDGSLPIRPKARRRVQSSIRSWKRQKPTACGWMTTCFICSAYCLSAQSRTRTLRLMICSLGQKK